MAFDPGAVIPTIGVTFGAPAAVVIVAVAAVRLAFAPVLKARRLAAGAAATSSADAARLEARMDALEEEVRHLGQALDRVAAAAEFDAQLRAGAAPRLPPG